MSAPLKKFGPWVVGALAALLVLSWIVWPGAPKAVSLPAKGTGKNLPRKRRTVREVVAAAFRDADAHDWVDYDTITAEKAEAIRARTKSDEDFTGWRRLLTAGEVRKILNKHASDSRPVTADDFARLPEMLSCPIGQRLEKRSGQRLDVLVSTVHDAAGKTLIVEEVRKGRRKLALLSIYRP